MPRRGGGFPPRQQSNGRTAGRSCSKSPAKPAAGYFEVSKKLPIDQIYDRIEEELRNQYSLGYTPDRTDAGSAFRKIAVTVKQRNMIVQTRQGYYPQELNCINRPVAADLPLI